MSEYLKTFSSFWFVNKEVWNWSWMYNDGLSHTLQKLDQFGKWQNNNNNNDKKKNLFHILKEQIDYW